MTLYNKLKEFDTLLTQARSDSQKTLEYAQNELKEFTQELIGAKESALARELKGDLNALSLATQSHLERKLLELFSTNKSELIERVRESLDMQEIEAHLKQVIISEDKELLHASFKDFLKTESEDIAIKHKEELLEGLRGQVESLVRKESELIVQEVVKELDFSFLKEQPQVFYDVIINSLGELITNKLESEYLKECFKAMGSEIFSQVSSMQNLKEMELESQLHLLSLHAQNELISLEGANAWLLGVRAQSQKIEAQIELEQKNHALELLRLENAMLLEQKRKEALENGQLPQEAAKQYSYKVV